MRRRLHDQGSFPGHRNPGGAQFRLFVSATLVAARPDGARLSSRNSGPNAPVTTFDRTNAVVTEVPRRPTRWARGECGGDSMVKPGFDPPGEPQLGSSSLRHLRRRAPVGEVAPAQ